MPNYLFSNDKTGEIKEIFQKIDEKHEYTDETGQKWRREFTVPQASIDSQIDPFSKKQFSEKTGNKKGTVGDIWDRSRELSIKREQIAGKDHLKEKYRQDWSKKRNGRPFPNSAE